MDHCYPEKLEQASRYVSEKTLMRGNSMGDCIVEGPYGHDGPRDMPRLGTDLWDSRYADATPSIYAADRTKTRKHALV